MKTVPFESPQRMLIYGAWENSARRGRRMIDIKRFSLPSEPGKAIVAVVLAISAATTFIWYFMARAGALKSRANQLEMEPD